MADLNFLQTYVQACTNGKLALSECGPVWQMGVIAALLAAAITFLIVLRIQARSQLAP